MIIPTVNLSVVVLAGGTASTGYLLQNTSLHSIWVDSGRAAANDGSSILLAPGEAIDSTTPGFGIAPDLAVLTEFTNTTVAIKHD